MVTRRGLFRFSGAAAVAAAFNAVFPEFAKAEVLPRAGKDTFVNSRIGASGYHGNR
jgi:hypothetical protein